MADAVRDSLDRMYNLAIRHAAEIADLYVTYPFTGNESNADVARMIAAEIRTRIKTEGN